MAKVKAPRIPNKAQRLWLIAEGASDLANSDCIARIHITHDHCLQATTLGAGRILLTGPFASHAKAQRALVRLTRLLGNKLNLDDLRTYLES